MKRLIAILLICFSLIANAQLPKHVEFVSEVADTMVLINKPDLDKINTTFYMFEQLDSLNTINEQLINSLKIQTSKLENIVSEQNQVISNKDTQIDYITKQNKEIVSDLEKQVKRANSKTAFWEGISGIGVIAIIILAIL